MIDGKLISTKLSCLLLRKMFKVKLNLVLVENHVLVDPFDCVFTVRRLFVVFVPQLIFPLELVFSQSAFLVVLNLCIDDKSSH